MEYVKRENILFYIANYWDLENILNTSWWHKNLKKINHSEGAEYTYFTYN